MLLSITLSPVTAQADQGNSVSLHTDHYVDKVTLIHDIIATPVNQFRQTEARTVTLIIRNKLSLSNSDQFIMNKDYTTGYKDEPGWLA